MAATVQPLTDEQQRLVEDHLGLVTAIARGWRSRCRTTIELDELVQVGSLGLVDAARRYDPARSATFGAMAAERIRGAICDHFRSLDPLTRDKRRAVRELEETQRDLRTRLGREPGRDEVSRRLGWTEGQVGAAKDDAAALAAGWARSHDASEWLAGEKAEDGGHSDPTPLAEILRSEKVGQLREALESLSERDRIILDLYYREELQMHEIGKILGVTESRISQLRTAALSRLRAQLAAPAVAA